jgi:hypothetical protein
MKEESAVDLSLRIKRQRLQSFCLATPSSSEAGRWHDPLRRVPRPPDSHRGKRRTTRSVSSIPRNLLTGRNLYAWPTRLPILSPFQCETTPLNVKAGTRDALSRLSFTLGALMPHVAKPFDHLVRGG